MRPKGSAELLSDRRRRALRLLGAKFSLNEVARRIGCAASSVMRWRNAWRRRGTDSLQVRFSPGRPRRLTRRQERRLVRILLQGAVANGYRTELWTTKRVAEVIQRSFHVPCHFNTAGQLLHRLGWTHQKPEGRALERNEKAIERWKRKDWPRVKKNAARLGAHLVFADESGFLLAPLVVKTWASRGCTPLHRHRQGRRDKISVISGISLSPKRHHLGLYYLLFYDNIAQEEVCVFLRELLRQLRGPVIVLLDNSSTHQGEPLQKLLGQHPRLRVKHFPSYAPELNPDEGVWSLAKRELANSCPKDVDELMEDIIRSINGIRSSPAKLRGCILQSELPPFFALVIALFNVKSITGDSKDALRRTSDLAQEAGLGLARLQKGLFAQHALRGALFPGLGEEDFEGTRSWYEGIAPTLESRIYPIDYLRSSIHFRAQPHANARGWRVDVSNLNLAANWLPPGLCKDSGKRCPERKKLQVRGFPYVKRKEQLQ